MRFLAPGRVLVIQLSQRAFELLFYRSGPGHSGSCPLAALRGSEMPACSCGWDEVASIRSALRSSEPEASELNATVGNMRVLCAGAARRLAPTVAQVGRIQDGDVLLIPDGWPVVVRARDRQDLASAVAPASCPSGPVHAGA